MPLSETIPPAYNIDFSKKSFLIVDDFQGMRSMLRDIVRNCGADAKHIATRPMERKQFLRWDVTSSMLSSAISTLVPEKTASKSSKKPRSAS